MSLHLIGNAVQGSLLAEGESGGQSGCAELLPPCLFERRCNVAVNKAGQEEMNLF